MLVKKIYDASDLMDEFEKVNRSNSFSIEGLTALMELFGEDEEPTELDVIAICYEFTECTPAEIAENYGYRFHGTTGEPVSYEESVKNDHYEGETLEYFMDELNYHTWAKVLDNGNVIYCNYQPKKAISIAFQNIHKFMGIPKNHRNKRIETYAIMTAFGGSLFDRWNAKS